MKSLNPVNAIAKARWTSSHVATLAAAIFGGFLLANGFLLYSSISDVRMHNRDVTASYDVLRRTETVFSLFKDMYIGSRGYLLTGRPDYLAPLDAAQANIFTEIDDLIKAAAFNRDQQSRVRQFRELTDQFLVLHQDFAKKLQRFGDADRTESFATGRSRALYDLMQRVANDVFAEEKRTLSAKVNDAVRAEDSMNRSLFFSTIGNFVLVIVIALFMRRYLTKQDEDTWLSSGYAAIADTIRDQSSEKGLCETIVSQLATLLDAPVANMYTVRSMDKLRLSGSFGSTAVQSATEEISFGEGLVGEVARHEKIMQLDDLPSSHLTIKSSLGFSPSRSLLVFPVIVHGQLIAVIEFGRVRPFRRKHLRLLHETAESIGAAIESAEQQTRLNSLLTAMEMQTAELASKEEVLRESNKELEAQASVLESQKEILAERNQELEAVRSELERRAVDLEKAGRYKSEFLANMSHELRTPLNSLLILSSLLLENRNLNLTDKELEFLTTINRSGTDLLALINDILDLSKVAAGKLEIVNETVSIQKLSDSISQSFSALAETKGLKFEVEIAPDCPPSICSDGQRIEQILRNFLSNALKFTQAGGVRVVFAGSSQGGLTVSVRDSGIGIPKDKFEVIFGAFQQADGSTSRRFGGTGLGLTISRDLSGLLSGSIRVESAEGRGSEFILTLPLKPSGSKSRVTVLGPETTEQSTSERHMRAATSTSFNVDGNNFNLPEHQDVLEINATSDIHTFSANTFRRGQGGRQGAEALTAFAGTGGPSDLQHFDTGLVHNVIETPSDQNSVEVGDGLFSFRKVLIADDDMRNVYALLQALGRYGAILLTAKHGGEALEVLRANPDVSMVLMDTNMPVMDGFEAIRQIRTNESLVNLPIIALTSTAAEGEAKASMDAGANGYASKPVDIERLVAQMKLWFEVTDTKGPSPRGSIGVES